jgi:hypothetical protein
MRGASLRALAPGQAVSRWPFELKRRGRKDVMDAMWLAELTECGLLLSTAAQN